MIAALFLTFMWALYLSKLAGNEVTNAFAYQSAVVSAQRDADLLENRQSASPAQVRAYEKLLDTDLAHIDTFATNPDEHAPRVGDRRTSDDYARLDTALNLLADRGQRRFTAVAKRNVQLRNTSNALFALVAFLFVIAGARMRYRLERGRTLVERLQHAFISRPDDLPHVSIGGVLLSATKGSSVGGDLFDVYTFDGRHGALLVADVSGKGIDAAVDTAFIKYSIRTLFVEHTDPAEVLTKFSHLYASNAEADSTFVVMFFAVVDTETGVLRYASAGHEPAWVRRNGKIEMLAPTGPLVGVMEDGEYEVGTIALQPGDMLLLSTDGLTESRDKRGEMLTAAGVGRWFSESKGGAQETADEIVRRLRERSRIIGDDLAILVARYDP
ncbi:MAG: serine/threonine-protein phosphatase [Candidatus Eremiobacteraeota bacterium]|nr:serine/threonine-protein phosphatase [Candidatus Eremiobacteraeota bacterium]